MFQRFFVSRGGELGARLPVQLGQDGARLHVQFAFDFEAFELHSDGGGSIDERGERHVEVQKCAF